ncbi:MAG TPA: xanthine dehydrogenase family protein subunit M [Vicinamibacterales bacterium]|nr:xanthine dehydrogenase family protein subunit M [Vicinamibacterales bacterium]
MFAAAFDYYRAGSIAEAHKLLREHPDARLLAGGHSLIPLMKMRLAMPAALVDIGRIASLKGITARGASLRIGSLTTHAELASSPVLQSACPMLAEAAGLIGDSQVRNMGTIGGNIAHADPASDLPAVLLALDATIHAAGPNGERAIPIAGFFQGMMTTALGPDEILTAIDVPAKQAGQGMAYVKFRHPASGYAVLGAAAVVSVADGACTSARVAIGGLLPAPVRCGDVERTLEKQRISSESLARAASQVRRVLNDDVMGDIFASVDYRKAMAPIYVTRALTSASSQTG